MHSLPPSQRSTCSTCQQSARVLIHSTHVLVFAKSTRRIEWDECYGCYEKEEARGAALRAEAEADRRVKLRAEAERKRRPSAGPFALQIEGADE